MIHYKEIKCGKQTKSYFHSSNRLFMVMRALIETQYWLKRNKTFNKNN